MKIESERKRERERGRERQMECDRERERENEKELWGRCAHLLLSCAKEISVFVWRVLL